jgi:hypothetical protein
LVGGFYFAAFIIKTLYRECLKEKNIHPLDITGGQGRRFYINVFPYFMILMEVFSRFSLGAL